MTDFDHIDDEIKSIDREIDIEYDGRSYEELNEKERQQVMLDHFFHGQSKYRSSATKLQIGYDSYINGETGSKTSVTKINFKSGGSRYVIRDENGRFKKWV